MNEAVAFITTNGPVLLDVAARLIAAAAIIASLTPSPKDDSIIGKIQGGFKKVIDLFGFNFGNAKNATK